MFLANLGRTLAACGDRCPCRRDPLVHRREVRSDRPGGGAAGSPARGNPGRSRGPGRDPRPASAEGRVRARQDHRSCARRQGKSNPQPPGGHRRPGPGDRAGDPAGPWSRASSRPSQGAEVVHHAPIGNRCRRPSGSIAASSWRGRPCRRTDPGPIGKWSTRRRTYEILDNVPAMEEERVPESNILGNLVDPLPFLTDGHWRGVDIEEFLPPRGRARRAADRPEPGLASPRGQAAGSDGAQPRFHGRARPDLPLSRPGRPVQSRRDREHPRKVIFGPWSEATDIVTIPAP